MATKIKTKITGNMPSADGKITGPGTGPGTHPGNGTSPGGSDTSPKIPKDTTTKTIKDK